jgi:tetratricopeptide (TPR) repeat protein
MANATPMVGPSVGSSDLFVSQGNKAYNDGKYSDARDAYLKAARAKPDNVPIYLSLARAYMQTKEIALACYAYRVYLKAAPTAPDHDKAQSEQEQCEHQKSSMNPPPTDPGPGFVDQKAAFQEAAEGDKLLGPASASDVLQKMLQAGYSAPDLADMGTKLRTVAEKDANAGYDAAIRREVQDPAQLRNTAALYALAQDVGSTDEQFGPRQHLLEGFASLLEKKYDVAEKEFKAAAGSGNGKDAKFYGAVAAYRSGDRKRAIKMLETDLPDDPRTPLLRTDALISTDAKEGAQELEKMLFNQRFAQAQNHSP